MIARPRFLLYAFCALSWIVPFNSIEEHVAVTFTLFALYEAYRVFPRRIAESEEVPEKARTLRLQDISFKEDNS